MKVRFSDESLARLQAIRELSCPLSTRPDPVTAGAIF